MDLPNCRTEYANLFNVLFKNKVFAVSKSMQAKNLKNLIYVNLPVYIIKILFLSKLNSSNSYV